jgi:hypothetical protein
MVIGTVSAGLGMMRVYLVGAFGRGVAGLF